MRCPNTIVFCPTCSKEFKTESEWRNTNFDHNCLDNLKELTK